MRFRSLLPGALALSTFWLAGCGDIATEPTRPAALTPSGPELAVASNSWITRANLGTNRTGLALATVVNAAGQSIVYAIGGATNGVPVNKVTAYNVGTNTWTSRRPLPVPLAWSNGTGVINGKIYVSGGFSDAQENFPNRLLYMYDPGTNTWTRKHDLPASSWSWMVGAKGATGVINGKLYVVTPCFGENAPYGYYEGLCDETPNATGPLFFRYNPVTDRWATLPPPFPATIQRDLVYSPLAGGVIGGKFYVTAGDYAGNGRLSVYDPATNQWTRKTPLGLARPGAATAVLGNQLYVMGGNRFNATRELWQTLDITIVYDPVTDAWTRRTSLPSPRAYIAGTTVLLNGQPRIELVGGSLPGNNLQYIP